MATELKVKVNSYGPGRPLSLVYVDPVNGKKVAKSVSVIAKQLGMKLANPTSEKEAAAVAGAWEIELKNGRYKPASKVTWLDFTLRYTSEVLPGMAQKTRAQLGTIFNTVERIISPKRLADVSAERLSHLAGRLREEGKAEITIRNYLAHLRASLAWAAGLKMLAEVPQFPKIHRAKKKRGAAKVMKGRPIAAEEFERMLSVVPRVLTGQDKTRPEKVCDHSWETGKQRRVKPSKPAPQADPASVESWKHYLRGLWWSGLRLQESVELSWDRKPGCICVDLSERYPTLQIPADAQKSAKDQVYPVAPEFAEFLLATPEGKRRGRVFRLLGAVNPRGGPASVGPVSNPDYVSHVLSRIGRVAGVKVDAKVKRDGKTGQPKEVTKYASAHDLRRSFGFRWSRRIMPVELKELMRHANIETTLAYYVGQNAQTTAESLWVAYQKATGCNHPAVGNTSGNSVPKQERIDTPRNDTSPCVTRAYQAHPTGLEPVTFGSVDRCSIQLS